ncbi:MAG: LacI family transcriptional regulator [Bifidobacteriaceae bacterium]|nr:LacI family transcriptional regulator [Bifidobacteriaceae bacterium]
MAGARATIVDVAQAAGVSLGTASNVLNKPERVAPATRQRVERAIEQLGFVPSGAARQLRSGGWSAVGAVLLDIRNPFYTDVARGIEDQLDPDRQALLVGSSDGDPRREARYLRLFESQGVAGALVASVDQTGSVCRELAERGLKLVLLESEFPDLPISSVRVDNRAGARAAVRHLMGLGFDRVTMFNGPPQLRQCAERAAGAAEALAGLGPSAAPAPSPGAGPGDGRGADAAAGLAALAGGRLRQIEVGQIDSRGGAAAAAAWLAGDPGPSAIFCVNDLVAIGVQRALRRAGRYSPERYPIVGFDDIDAAQDRAVPLTSVRQPTYQMGRRAAAMLAQAGPGQAVEHITFVPELVVRASTEPPPGRGGGPGGGRI